MLDASPSFHFAGTFGQEGSSWNIGTPPARSWDVCAATLPFKWRCPCTPTTITNAVRTAHLRILRLMAFTSSLHKSNFRCEFGFLFRLSAICTVIHPYTSDALRFFVVLPRCGSSWRFGDCVRGRACLETPG